MKSPSGELLALESMTYATEDELQRFVAEHPELLATTLAPTEQAAPWLLVRRELAIVMEEGDERTRWSLDHLFVDGDGIPTLVEVKRSSDPRARREVVAQMLDYAASFRHHWSAESLRALFAGSFDGSTKSADEALEAFLNTTAFADEDAFWAEVQTNILANRLRLLFVADRFTAHLVRIIEYLNEQLRTTEVVGIEVVPHAGSSPGLIAYVPTVRGQTTAVPATKGSSERRTQTEFDDVLRANHGDAAVMNVAELVDAARGLGGYPTIGTDIRNPRLFINFKTHGVGKAYWPLGINSRPGKVAIQLRWLANHPAFADEDRRAEIVSRFTEALGVPIDAPRLDGFPGFPIAALVKPGVVKKVTDVLRWMTEVADAQRDADA
jgi:hypothetical protein